MYNKAPINSPKSNFELTFSIKFLPKNKSIETKKVMKTICTSGNISFG